MSESTVPQDPPPQAQADAAAETNSGAPMTEYDPSQPMEYGEYDPSQPAEYDPSQPAEYDPSQQQQQQHDDEPPQQPEQEQTQGQQGDAQPAQPAQPEGEKEGEGAAEPEQPEQPQQEYDPSQQQEQEYDPSQPTGEYDPSQPMDEYDPSQPMEYDPSQPMETESAEQSGQPEIEEPAEGGPVAAPVPELEPGVVPGLPQVNAETELAPAPATAPVSLAARAAIPENEGVQEDVYKADLPEGLTLDSPSVVANQELVRQYRLGKLPEASPS